ncbi:hypothetical protein [Halorubrum sp. 2020YC2]|uniref:DUF7344 domain-containing protein n=1 Tax=Halorubrum sp. 2020YC2 TaxID=2836432 RepID=UPI001BE6062E|nr:hypothetical protein [Halorubrum sp. 2020YC2]QWC20191.1 hypothetical protein KI388_04365 [Halorubrum sp. 2020YC2]
MSDTRLDASLRLVSNGRRREILRGLRRGPTDTATVESLIDRLRDGGGAGTAEADATTEATATAGAVPSRERLSIQLVHTHLPKLSDHGVIDYDRDADEVRYRPDPHVEAVLDGLPAEESRSVPES